LFSELKMNGLTELIKDARVHPDFVSDDAVAEKVKAIGLDEKDLLAVCDEENHRLVRVLFGSALFCTAQEFANQREFLLMLNGPRLCWEPLWLSKQNKTATETDEIVDYTKLSMAQGLDDAALRNLFGNHEFKAMLARVAQRGYLAAFDGVLTRTEYELGYTDDNKAMFTMVKRKLPWTYKKRYNYWKHRPWYVADPSTATAEEIETSKQNFAHILAYLVSSFAQIPYDLYKKSTVVLNQTISAIDVDVDEPVLSNAVAADARSFLQETTHSDDIDVDDHQE
jgi:hypothetical protein